MSDLVDELRAAAKISTWAPNNANRMKRAADTLAAVEKLHYARPTVTSHGIYKICDYDKTLWPCRTHKILNPEEG